LSLVTKKSESEPAQEQSQVQEVRITCKNKTTTIVIRPW
jgi:hypothetical protein